MSVLRSQLLGIVLTLEGRARYSLHDEEPGASGCGPGTDDPRNGDATVGEVRHDARLACDVVGRLGMATRRRFAQHPFRAVRGGDDRGDVGLPEADAGDRDVAANTFTLRSKPRGYGGGVIAHQPRGRGAAQTG